MLDRLVRNWVYGGFLAGLLLLGLTWTLARGWPYWLTGTWLMLPLYMLHQYEEHDADRFRLFTNRTMAGGREALSPLAVFVINIPGVWGVIALAFWLAWNVRPGLGLIAVYLVLVNALGHIGGGLAMRRYNPGLATAVLIFIPFGGMALRLQIEAGATKADHSIGLGVAVAIHVAIVAWVRLRTAMLRRASGATREA